MARLYTGTYGSGTTAENALNTALLQYPEIARTLISQYPRYSATYLLERTGRFAKEKVLGDNSFEWKVMGRYNTPSYSNGWASTDGVTFVGYTSAGELQLLQLVIMIIWTLMAIHSIYHLTVKVFIQLLDLLMQVF